MLLFFSLLLIWLFLVTWIQMMLRSWLGAAPPLCSGKSLLLAFLVNIASEAFLEADSSPRIVLIFLTSFTMCYSCLNCVKKITVVQLLSVFGEQVLPGTETACPLFFRPDCRFGVHKCTLEKSIPNTRSFFLSSCCSCFSPRHAGPQGWGEGWGLWWHQCDPMEGAGSNHAVQLLLKQNHL